MYSYSSDVCNVLSNSTVNNVTVLYIIIKKNIRTQSGQLKIRLGIFITK